MRSTNVDKGPDDHVSVEKNGLVATVILNRPDKLNALTKEMWGRIGQIFKELDGEENLRCIILRGISDRALGSGADISEFETKRKNSGQARRYGKLMHDTMRAIRSCRHPVVVRIKGICVGGALELALGCDLRIAGESSRFGIPINRLGLVMAHPEIEMLVNVVGPAVALEILYEGRVFNAVEAKEKGLINKVVPDDQVDAAVVETVEHICNGAPLVNRWHKRFVYAAVDGAGENKALTAAQIAEDFACFDTDDYREGIRAFFAKEVPDFQGK